MRKIYYLLILVSTYSYCQGSRQSDSLALVDLYQSTNGLSWRSSWDIENLPMNEWNGVTVSDQRVTELNLSFNELSGILPNSIGSLSEIEVIKLGFNQALGGRLPLELGKCRKLRLLDISSTAIEGEMPMEFGDLIDLEYLNLSNNKLSGDFQELFRPLGNLKYLNLNGYVFSDSIPDWIGELVALEELYLEGCNLSGGIPNEVGQLKKLKTLVLRSNSLNGTIPVSVKELKSLAILRLGYNALSGEIPTELGDCLSLSFLDLSHNQLEGEIPDELGNLTELGILSVGSNNLTGAIPSSLTQLEKLSAFYAHENKFTGLPDFTHLILKNESFLRFWVMNNQLPFGDIIKNISLNEENEFRYEGQNILDKKFFEMNVNDIVTLSVSDTTEGNRYLWYKNNKPIYEATSSKYEIRYKREDEGHYFCEISNDQVSNLFIDHDGYYLFDKVNSAPTDLSLENYWIPQDSISNNFISKINIEDSDVLDAHELYLVDGDRDSEYFRISSDSLFSRNISRFEYEQDYKLRLGVKDSSLAFFEKEVTLLVDGGRSMDSLALIELYQSLDGGNWRFKWDVENHPISEWVGIYLNDHNRVSKISLRSNKLSGNLPDGIGKLRFLRDLDLTGNNIQGEIPKGIQYAKSLIRLRLGDNEMSGSIPKEIGNLDNLFRLDLSNNHFTGKLPIEFQQLLGLTDLFLQSNQISHIPRLSRLRLRHSYGDLRLQNNKLGLESILRNLGVENFNYFNQSIDETVIDTVNYGLVYKLFVSDTTYGASYNWYKDFVTLGEGDKEYEFIFSSESEGTYTCEITHPDVPGLVIKREPYILYDYNFHRPTGIRLLGDSILENSEAGTLIGILQAEDLDEIDDHSYSIISEDSTFFYVEDDKLYSSYSLNYEDRASDGYSLVFELVVEVRDQAGEWYQADDVYVRVIDVNENPTDILLSNSMIDEDVMVGTVVGLLNTVDQDYGDSHIYEVEGDSDFFLIRGDSLIVSSSLNFETDQNHELHISVRDNNGNIFQKIVLVEVLDKNDSPTDINLSSDRIEENQPEGTLVGKFETIDEDKNDSHFYQIIKGLDNFYMESDSLFSSRTFDFEEDSILTVEVASMDQEGSVIQKNFVISLVDLEEVVTGVLKDYTFSVYPNPMNKQFVLSYRIDQNARDFNYKIYTLSGLEMQSGEIDVTVGQHHEEISIDKLESGMYFLRLSSSDGNFVKAVKIVKY
ncbi:MAG: T9SS type A sorting domain-containing protein [Cyclobacteriaceae bacterium]